MKLVSVQKIKLRISRFKLLEMVPDLGQLEVELLCCLLIDVLQRIEPLTLHNLELIVVQLVIASVRNATLPLLLSLFPSLKQCLHLAIRLNPLGLFHNRLLCVVLSFQLVESLSQALVLFQKTRIGVLDVPEHL